MKAKPIIIIIVTLALGIFIGMLVSAKLRYHRLKPVRVFFSEQRFREGFYNIIQPDEKQKETIEVLLGKYAKINSSIQTDFRKKMDTTMKDFWKELEPVLSKDQLERLREMEQRRIEMYRNNQRNQKYQRGDSLYDGRMRGRRGMPPPPDHQPGERMPFRERPDSSSKAR